MKKKSPQQLKNAGSKKGIAKHKKETLADKIVSESAEVVPVKYPILIAGDSEDDELARQYFDLYIDSFNQMDVIFQDQDAIMLAMLCQQFILYTKQIEEATRAPILEEINGNTGQIVKKSNPAVKASQQTLKVVLSMAERLGQTPVSRAKIFEIAATVKALNHSTKGDSDRSQGRPDLDSWIRGAHNINNKHRS